MNGFSDLAKLAGFRRGAALPMWAAGGACLPLLLWLVLATNALDATRAQLEDARARHLLVRQLAHEYAGLVADAAVSDRTTRGADDILRLLARSGQAAGISLTRLRQGDDGRVTAVADNIEYAALVDWLIALRRRHDLPVVRIAIDAADGNGRVNCRMSFSATASGPPAPGQYDA